MNLWERGHNSTHNTRRERKMHVAGGEAEGGRDGGEERLREGGAGKGQRAGGEDRPGWLTVARLCELSLPECFWRAIVGWC